MEAFQKLPLDLLANVLEHLPHADLKNARLVSRKFNSAAVACGFFYHLFVKLPDDEPIPPVAPSVHSGGPPDVSRHIPFQGEREILLAMREYILIVRRLLQYRRRDWLQHITVRSAALLPLTGALFRHGLYDLQKLTILLDKSPFSNSTVAAFIYTINVQYPRMFINVKELIIDVKNILSNSVSSPFSYLTSFAAGHTPNLEKLTLKTALNYPALPASHPLVSGRYSIHNFACWDHLHTLHLKGFMLEIIPFANLILKQPRLEFVFLEILNLNSANPIPEEFYNSAWVWFFNEFGKEDNTFLRATSEHPIVLRPAVWAKTQFLVDQLSTLDVFEDCDSWEFPNVKKMPDYVSN